MSTISMFGTCQNCGLVQYLQGQPCRDCGGKVQSGGRQPEAPCRTTSGAHCPGDGVTECKKCPAEHVPPAGGDVEAMPQRRNWSGIASWKQRAEINAWNAACDAWEPHVTRLQAEVERLKLLADKRWNDLTEESDKSSAEIYALQSELTKARELLIPAECPHMIVFDDADREPLTFAGEGARAAALKTWEQISGSWNAHLFVRVERNSRDDRYPSANQSAPADNGEV